MNYQALTQELRCRQAEAAEDIRSYARDRICYLRARRKGLLAAGQIIEDEEKTNEIITMHRETIRSCTNWLKINGWEE